MLTKMAKSISSFFIKNGSIREDDRKVYDYCFEILLSTILNLLLVVIIAIFTKTMLPTLFYITGFMVVRSTAGGYHANTHLSCVGILLGAYTAYLLLLKLICNDILLFLTSIFLIMSISLVFFLSPVEDKNKPITSKERKILKRKSRIWISALSLIAIALILVFPYVPISFSLAAGMVTVACSLIAGKIKNNILNLKRSQ